MSSQPLIQYAALPFRSTKTGLEVLLITTRSRRRWILPKGRPDAGLAGWQTAAREAWEEAGVRGRVATAPCGVFHSAKKTGGTGTTPTQVLVFPLEVTWAARKWPEKSERRRTWLPVATAAEHVEEAGLMHLLRRFESMPLSQFPALRTHWAAR